VGTIHTDDLGAVLRSLGRNLTEAQVNSYTNEHDNDGGNTIDFGVFHSIMCRHEHEMPGPCDYNETLEAFAAFDLYKDGTLSAADFVHMLREMGEPLTEQDVNQLLKEVAIDGDQRINIQAFVSHMFESSLVADDEDDDDEDDGDLNLQQHQHQHQPPQRYVAQAAASANATAHALGTHASTSTTATTTATAATSTVALE
jgi:calmodulin